jgi:hypothetical protein
MRTLNAATALLLLPCLLGCEQTRDGKNSESQPETLMPATKSGDTKARDARSGEDELEELAIKFSTAATFDDLSSCLNPDSAKMFSREAWEKSTRPAIKRDDIKVTKVEITGDAAVIHCMSPTGKRGVVRSLWATKRDGEWLLTFAKAKAPLHKSRLGTAREKARQAHCRSNLMQMAGACRLFSKDNDGKLPPTLEALFPKYVQDKDILSCPSKRGAQDYSYVAGISLTAPDDSVVAYDNAGNHEGGRIVVFLDAKAKWMTEQEFQEALKKTRMHLKAGGSRTR